MSGARRSQEGSECHDALSVFCNGEVSFPGTVHPHKVIYMQTLIPAYLPTYLATYPPHTEFSCIPFLSCRLHDLLRSLEIYSYKVVELLLL